MGEAGPSSQAPCRKALLLKLKLPKFKKPWAPDAWVRLVLLRRLIGCGTRTQRPDLTPANGRQRCDFYKIGGVLTIVTNPAISGPSGVPKDFRPGRSTEYSKKGSHAAVPRHPMIYADDCRRLFGHVLLGMVQP